MFYSGLRAIKIQGKFILFLVEDCFRNPATPIQKAPLVAGFPTFLENLPPTVRAYFRALRLEIKRNAAQGGDWRDIINALRPHTPGIWRRFSVEERQKFLSHVVPYWDIHRHRLAPAAHLRLSGMLRSGQVETIAGYIQNYKMRGENVSIER